MSYKVWHDKSKTTTVSRITGCWDSLKNDYKDLIQKETEGIRLNDAEKILLWKNKKAVEYLALSFQGATHRAPRKRKRNGVL